VVNLKTIEAFFDDYQFDENVLILSECETITDLKKYIDTNIHILKKNSGKLRYAPYFYRLERVYKKLKRDAEI
jgi:collagenase-like PrtC family protease